MIPKTGLCVGLDLTVPPQEMVAIAKRIINATRASATCFKLNLAFYEQYGMAGINAMYAIREYLADAYVIADAKRGDIGNTSAAYARSVFDDLNADAITVAPYMGADSVEPFLASTGKMVYVLALTSNPGSADFQRRVIDGTPLYEHVMHTALQWQRTADIGFVVGATHPQELASIRAGFPNVPLLIPGIGAQGGDAQQTAVANAKHPAVFNVSRGLMNLLNQADNDQAVVEEARRLAGLLSV